MKAIYAGLIIVALSFAAGALFYMALFVMLADEAIRPAILPLQCIVAPVAVCIARSTDLSFYVSLVIGMSVLGNIYLSIYRMMRSRVNKARLRCSIAFIHVVLATFVYCVYIL